MTILEHLQIMLDVYRQEEARYKALGMLHTTSAGLCHGVVVNLERIMQEAEQ